MTLGVAIDALRALDVDLALELVGSVPAHAAAVPAVVALVRDAGWERGVGAVTGAMRLTHWDEALSILAQLCAVDVRAAPLCADMLGKELAAAGRGQAPAGSR